MRRILRLSVLLALAVGILYSSPTGKTQNSTVAQQLNQIEQQLAKAVMERDMQTYSSLLAPDRDFFQSSVLTCF
jgi:hypothetical protein